MIAEIGWTHDVVIMEKCKTNQQREFYILMTPKKECVELFLGQYYFHSSPCQVLQATHKKTCVSCVLVVNSISYFLQFLL